MAGINYRSQTPMRNPQSGGVQRMPQPSMGSGRGQANGGIIIPPGMRPAPPMGGPMMGGMQPHMGMGGGMGGSINVGPSQGFNPGGMGAGLPRAAQGPMQGPPMGMPQTGGIDPSAMRTGAPVGPMAGGGGGLMANYGGGMGGGMLQHSMMPGIRRPMIG